MIMLGGFKQAANLKFIIQW